jgi:hypothetical protein
VFGDGGSSTAQHPTHQYSAAGTYDVSLTATNLGGFDTETKTGYITVMTPPTADFIATPTGAAAPADIVFEDRSASTPSSWAWDFGDGATSTQQHPSHQYAKPSYYPVTLTVSNAGGTDTTTKEHYIAVTFPDVPFVGDPASWAVFDIIACATDNITQGSGGLYLPANSVSRDQMAVYISRALVRPSGDAGIADPVPPPTFSDVGNGGLGDWAYKQIEYAASQGVVQGFMEETPGGTVVTYRPTLLVDRGQMAVYIARAMNAPLGDAAIPAAVPPYHFADVPGADNKWAWCLKHVEYLAGLGIVKGLQDGDSFYYHPEWPVTRDQMAVYIRRAFDLWVPE